MRRIDQYLGPPICLLLGAARFLVDRVRPRVGAGGEIRKLLVIKFWGLGSIVLSTPALRALKKRYPGATITFLTFEQNAGACRMIRAIDRVRPYRARGPLSFLASFADLVLFLRRERFDAVVDLEAFSNFTSILTALSGAPITVGFHTPKFWRARFYWRRVAFDQSQHIADIFLKAARALGADADGKQLDALDAGGGDAEPMLDRLLAERSVVATEPLVCINVNASPLDYKRRWPLAHYRELIARILSGFDEFRLVLIGARDEARYVAELTRSLPAHPNLIDLSGRISVEQLVLLLKRSELFIGNDSGPLHLAVAAGTPTISFFGPETPALYGPRGEGHVALYKGLPCSPCLNVHHSKENGSCRDNVCMKSIEVEEAWTVVREQLHATSRRRSMSMGGDARMACR
jgi:ADP-heptose:LPS heptosyltransferase